MPNLEQIIIQQPTPPKGIPQLLAEITPTSLAITLLIILTAWAITWGARAVYQRHHLEKVTPNWVHVLMRLILPLLLWLFAHGVMAFYEVRGASFVWFEFVARMFAAWLFVRVFLYVVRRALPEGTRRIVLERMTMVVIWTLMLADYVGVLPNILVRMESIALSFGASRISLLDVTTLLTAVLILWLVVQWLSHEIEDLLLKKPPQSLVQFDLSIRMVLVRVFKGGLIVLAILLALSASGIDLTVLSVFGGALGVGIGLGLQKIASNYVSGFVILFERSVRVGDLVSTSDGIRGFVRTINARYTLIEGASGDEILLPNEHLVTNPVTNWTLHDKKNWLSTQLPVNYDIDLDFIIPKIVRAVMALSRVARTPAPNVLLSSISDKGYILEVTWWLIDPENGRLNIISEVNLAAWRVLREHNVDVFTLKNIPAAPAPTVEHGGEVDVGGAI